MNISILIRKSNSCVCNPINIQISLKKSVVVSCCLTHIHKLRRDWWDRAMKNPTKKSQKAYRKSMWMRASGRECVYINYDRNQQLFGYFFVVVPIHYNLVSMIKCQNEVSRTFANSNEQAEKMKINWQNLTIVRLLSTDTTWI